MTRWPRQLNTHLSPRVPSFGVTRRAWGTGFHSRCAPACGRMHASRLGHVDQRSRLWGLASQLLASGRVGSVVVNRDEVLLGLDRIGVPNDLIGEIPELPDDVEALLVYGSMARGDAIPGSDLDLLAMVSRARPSHNAGLVNISFYTAETLATGVGTLFGAHLKRDGYLLFDEQGRLRRALDGMGDVDTRRLMHRALTMTELFGSLDRDLPRYLPGLTREARFLLRSCLYARAMADGAACFSVRELATRHGDPALATLLASRQANDPTRDELEECLSRLRSILGEFPPSRSGSLEATVVNEWGYPSDVLSMAFMALGTTGKGSDYAEVEKILL